MKKPASAFTRRSPVRAQVRPLGDEPVVAFLFELIERAEAVLTAEEPAQQAREERRHRDPSFEWAHDSGEIGSRDERAFAEAAAAFHRAFSAHRYATAMMTANMTFEDPPVARALFSSPRFAWIWLFLRVWLGFQWLSDGLDKAQNAAWTGAKAGTFLTTWSTKALTKTTGAHPDVQAPYAWFLSHVVIPNATLFSYLVVAGEILVGVGLIIGLFTGIAAFFGSFMNFNYLLAGTVSVNPIYFAAATLLVLAWKTAGYYGVDRWVLPALGTPWQREPTPVAPAVAVTVPAR